MTLTGVLVGLLISVILCTISFTISRKLENKSHWSTDFSVLGFAWLVTIICSAACLAALLIF
jgi:TRAP-type C4-dicarboxylate transport system permease small subunit